MLVVSNRLPVSLTQEGSGWITKRSSGGLATAMDSILKGTGGVWVGWSGISGDTPPEATELLRKEQSCIAVDLPADVQEKFYEGYSNDALWPLFHSFTSKLQFRGDYWEAYREANRRFCHAVIDEYQPGDRIWVHDYHLMLLPNMLREKLPEAAIGFFLHIPFPASDVFAVLPRGEELLQGLLGSDLIAFHTHQHLQHFRQSLRRLLGIESTVDRMDALGREVRLQALPISIAPQEFIETARTPETTEQLERLRAQYKNQKVIVAVDRLDYTKGIPERLRTLDRLLRENTNWHGKVVLLQVAVPSRENVETYRLLRSQVHELISSINGQFGTPDWVPIVYIHRNISRPELTAVYQLADVAWIGSLRDGMNLVAKEYVACHEDGRGVLVLSAFAGAAAEMGEALLINPLDEERTAGTVLRALNMSDDEKRERMTALHRRVVRNDVFAWGERFIGLLEEAAQMRNARSSEEPPLLPSARLIDSYREATKRLLLLDYDGTLVNFAARPHDARPDEELKRILTRLTSHEANQVYVISGRKAADLDRWLGSVPNLGLSAEHGARWRMPSSVQWQGRKADTKWKDSVGPILQHFADRTPGSLIEEKEFALVWHYRATEPEFGDWLATELVAMLEGMLAETELRAYRGHKIVEVKPMWANKGSFARELLSPYSEADFVIGIGDDRTDEDLFTELPGWAWSIHIGSGPTKARFRIPDTREVRRLLQQLTTGG
ncbi:MAG: bifunctional alpha,alpha-trehalose-phosphate synthase (UDP-forming)/trehalose-phosphatase [Bryobacteraceae bacterium]